MYLRTLVLLGQILLADAVEGNAPGKFLGVPEVFQNIPGASGSGIMTKRFVSMEEVVKNNHPVLFTDLRANPTINSWNAWERWKTENLVRIREYFSAAQSHEPGKGTTFNVGDNALNITTMSNQIYNQGNNLTTTLPEFFECSKKYHYIPGGQHPVFDPDYKPMGDIRYPDSWESQHVNIYWAGCKGTNTYLHYDGENVFLIQITGSKQLLIVPPSEWANVHLQPALHFSRRQSAAPVSGCLPSLDIQKWPLLLNLKRYHMVELNAGQALYLPSYWFHSVCNLSPSTAISIKGQRKQGFHDLFDHFMYKKTFRGLFKKLFKIIKSAYSHSSPEAIRISASYELLRTLSLAMSYKASSRRLDYGKDFGIDIQRAFKRVWHRYKVHQGTFGDDKDIEGFECEVVNASGNYPSLSHDMRKKVKFASLKLLNYFNNSRDSSEFDRLDIGRYPFEIEFHNYIEVALYEAVGGHRVNAALRAIITCLNSNRMELEDAYHSEDSQKQQQSKPAHSDTYLGTMANALHDGL